MIESVTTLPFNRHVGVQKSTTGEGLLEIPAGEQFLNHIGTVHAGAQLALAEACSGEFLLNALSNQTGIVPVVRRVEAKFKKPANGRVTARINTSLTAFGESFAELEAKGRCLLTIHVDLHDQQGQHSLAASFDWFVAKSAIPNVHAE
jgi:acyl-coenzyme A thioesterase PaaI-like protein